MKRAGYLFEAVVDFHALCAAARRASRGKRSSQAVAAFLLELEPEILCLQRELLDGSYRPRPYRSFWIRDPKPRRISAAAFRDRVVHHALCATLEPIFERYAINESYACRKGRGTLAAVKRAQAFSRRYGYFLKLDVRHYFETLDHLVLEALLGRLLKDRRVRHLIHVFLEAGAPGCPPGQGLPIGNLTSQHFANLYLGPLDHLIKEALRIPGYCRYMDDLLLFSDDRDHLVRARTEVGSFLSSKLNLALRDDVTRLAPVQAGVPFLGFRIWPGVVRFDPARARRFRRRFRDLGAAWSTSEIDEQELLRSSESLIGWARHANTLMFRRSFFQRLDENCTLPT